MYFNFNYAHLKVTVWKNMSSSVVLFWQGDRGDRGTRGQPGAVGPVGPMGAKVCMSTIEAFYLNMSNNNFTQRYKSSVDLSSEVVGTMLYLTDMMDQTRKVRVPVSTTLSSILFR